MMKVEGIDCKKYNYSLDKQAQVLCQYTAQILLSQDETELIIMNQKPILKEGKVSIDINEELKKGRKLEEINEALADNDFDNDGIDDEFEYTCKKSRTSCHIHEIKSFIFGGFSSRFWMLRKHINCLPHDELDKVPFYSWECISLELQNRSVDLVIQDQQKMN